MEVTCLEVGWGDKGRGVGLGSGGINIWGTFTRRVKMDGEGGGERGVGLFRETHGISAHGSILQKLEKNGNFLVRSSDQNIVARQ